MKIAFASIYGNLYSNDKLFDATACKLGQNLLMPDIILRNELIKEGHVVHTIDAIANYDIAIFRDIPQDSWLTINNSIDKIKYVLKMKWKRDYLLKAVHKLPKSKLILQINEPPTVAPQSYDKSNHKYFSKILTWNDDLVDNNTYYKFSIPEYWDHTILEKSYAEKKDYVIIASNKQSVHPKELYSKRKSIIDYFEENPSKNFDLYGYGWENEKLHNWKGIVARKNDTLSQYKFCFCFENIGGLNGYITEKIFDCFFSGCVPVYLGAANVSDYVPENTFIDARKFDNVNDLISSLENIHEAEYITYVHNARSFLESKKFEDIFSTTAFIRQIKKIIDLENT